MIPFPYQIGGAGLLGSDENRELLWDVASAVNAGTFSLGDRRMTGKGAGTYGNVRSTRALSGLAYVEIDATNSGTGAVVGAGLVGRSWPVASASYIGESGSCTAIWTPNRQLYLNAAVVGVVGASGDQRVQVAVRVSSRRVWARMNGGAWFGGGDPAADTSPSVTLGGSSEIYAAASIANALSAATIFAVSAHSHGPPAGFTAWG